MSLNTTEELIEDIREGRMIILMDDEDRENEGDFIMAADAVSPENINFMARYGRGLICLPLSPERCQKLNLPLMAKDFSSSLATNFTVSIDAAEGVTTGISAGDRAITIQKAVAKDAKPSDLVQPGHVFPLMAHPGGVMSRAGHTEAGCDLARLAGLEPAAVIVEILNDDGTMARRPDLEIIAKEHGLKIGTIADLIRYRTQNEKSVDRVTDKIINTEYGEFKLIAYRDNVKGDVHLALVKGVVNPDIPILVRVHLENIVYDLTGGVYGKTSWPMKDVLERFGKEESGVLVILSNQLEPESIIQEIDNINKDKDEIPKRPDDNSKDWRTIGLGSQILSDLGVKKMIVMSTPMKFHALSGFDLEVVDYAVK
jgi:3,4-dihydroxy 2-butanone 4-phosphate synthase/GTP cyclohydrolase II